VGKVDDGRRLVDEAVQHMGRLDVLVNNSGVEKAGACSLHIAGVSCCSAASNSSAILVLDAGFWPVIRFSSHTTCEKNGRRADSKCAPHCFKASASKKGTTLCIMTRRSSTLVKPVTFRPLTRGSPTAFRTLNRAAGPRPR
jgi:hypothetical protein